MPIGTSDGEHFEDAFHQAVVQQQQQATQNPELSRALNMKRSFGDVEPSQSIEDRRNSDPTGRPTDREWIEWGSSPAVNEAWHRGNFREEAYKRINENYLNQDLSKYEKDPLSKEAGISSVGKSPYTQDIDNVLKDSWFQKMTTPPIINRKYEVPYIAGADKNTNDYTTYIDKSVPKSVTISGKTFDPAEPLAIHEQVEREVMEHLIKRGMSNDKAYQIAHHEYAQVAEDNWYRQQGIDVNEVDKFWAKINQKTEKDKGDFPPNLYKKPYPHDQVKGEKHTPSDVFKEWPIGKEK